jgi:hypothetical protein
MRDSEFEFNLNDKLQESVIHASIPRHCGRDNSSKQRTPNYKLQIRLDKLQESAAEMTAATWLKQ